MAFFCSWCGSHKHNRGTCPNLAARQGTSRKYCGFCGSNNHTIDHCPKRFWNETARELERKRWTGKFDGVDLKI